MSTRSIRAAINTLRMNAEVGSIAHDLCALADAEVEAVERAAKDTAEGRILFTHVLALMESIAKEAPWQSS